MGTRVLQPPIDLSSELAPASGGNEPASGGNESASGTAPIVQPASGSNESTSDTAPGVQPDWRDPVVQLDWRSMYAPGFHAGSVDTDSALVVPQNIWQTDEGVATDSRLNYTTYPVTGTAPIVQPLASGKINSPLNEDEVPTEPLASGNINFPLNEDEVPIEPASPVGLSQGFHLLSSSVASFSLASGSVPTTSDMVDVAAEVDADAGAGQPSDFPAAASSSWQQGPYPWPMDRR